MAETVVNIYEAKTNLSTLVDRAAAGEEIIIAKSGRPKAKLVPVGEAVLRRPGGWEGRVFISDNFDDPLPQEILDGFEGKS